MNTRTRFYKVILLAMFTTTWSSHAQLSTSPSTIGFDYVNPEFDVNMSLPLTIGNTGREPIVIQDISVDNELDIICPKGFQSGIRCAMEYGKGDFILRPSQAIQVRIKLDRYAFKRLQADEEHHVTIRYYQKYPSGERTPLQKQVIPVHVTLQPRIQFQTRTLEFSPHPQGSVIHGVYHFTNTSHERVSWQLKRSFDWDSLIFPSVVEPYASGSIEFYKTVNEWYDVDQLIELTSENDFTHHLTLKSAVTDIQTYPHLQFLVSEVRKDLTKGGKGIFEFPFVNAGNTALVIEKVKSSCGCLVPSYPHEPIPPGDTAVILGKYDTNRIGPINRTMTVYSNCRFSPVQTIRLKGVVRLPEENNGAAKE